MTTDSEVKSKPLEYFIAKSTDPYVSVEDRTIYAEKLCEKVNYEIEGAQVAVTLIGHKISSPNQEEALNALKTVDLLVRRCGSKMHTRIGKFRFLNQLVKLLTPKYLGKETSEGVKREAIVLLYTWQKSMGHIEKFKEVYDNLRDHGYIPEEPIIPEESVLNVPAPPPRLAVFEDEEKSRLLSELLQSSNPDDLQAANRLIKSLVRSEDQKIEKINRRADDLEAAMRLCDKMELALRIGETTTLQHGPTYQKLTELRPILFRYASEAAENNEPVLADILVVNDNVNRIIDQYESRTQGSQVIMVDADKSPRHGGTPLHASPNNFDLLSGEDIGYDDRPTAAEVDLASELSAPVDDVPFIGFGSTAPTPVIPRRMETRRVDIEKAFEVENFSSLDQIFASQPIRPTGFKPTKLTLNDLSKVSSHAPLSLSPLDPLSNASSSDFEFQAALLSSPVRCLPESVHFTVQQMQLAARAPIPVMDKNNIKILIHYSQNSPPGTTGVVTVLITILNFNTYGIGNVHLKVTTNNLQVSSRLLNPESGNSIAPFTAASTVPESRRILLVLPLDNTLDECDFDYSLRYVHVIEEAISGTFRLRFI